MLAPIEAATTEHRAIEEGLGEMSAKAGMWDKLANQQSDPVAYAQYKTYADDLTKQADLLARQGLTPESRRGLLDMKRRYSNEITPIEVAATKREELTKAQREAIQKDPSLMFNIDYGTASLDDLKELELRGVRILTCGTCLNFYGLSEKLKVGEVTNMYEIAETMSKASLIVSP